MQLKVWDNPRNDALVEPVAHSDIERLFGLKYQKMILWMPTYRKSKKLNNHEDSSKDIPIIDAQNLIEINETLKSVGNLLVIKPHPLQNSITHLVHESSNIKILTNDDLYKMGIELYQFVGSADALITDYSSIYFDYLLLNRPIGFAYDDFEEYIKRRGFTVDNPQDLMPGTKINDTKTLCKFLSDPSADDKYEEVRRTVRANMSYWNDNQNCRRISDYVMNYVRDNGV